MAAAGARELVLVTGASGFIASHCVLQLLQAGYKVRGTVRDASAANAEKNQWLHQLCPEAKDNLELVSANLTKAEGWKEAVAGCKYVLHVASPFPASKPEDEKELIEPAVNGTKFVLNAVAEAGGVKRVVLTSSVAAVDSGVEEEKRPAVADETCWSDVDKCDPYPKSKTLAERAAWDLLNALPKEQQFELCTINPAYVLGPPLSTHVGTSFTVVSRLMKNQMPGVPELSFGIVDVRDVALAHLRAMKVDLPAIDTDKAPFGQGVGHRFILYSDWLWFKQMAEVLDKHFGPQGFKVPTTQVPYFVLWIVSIWDKQAAGILSSIGQVHKYDNTRARQMLGIDFKTPQESIIASAQGLIDVGLLTVPKK